MMKLRSLDDFLDFLKTSEKTINLVPPKLSKEGLMWFAIFVSGMFAKQFGCQVPCRDWEGEALFPSQSQGERNLSRLCFPDGSNSFKYFLDFTPPWEELLHIFLDGLKLRAIYPDIAPIDDHRCTPRRFLVKAVSGFTVSAL